MTTAPHTVGAPLAGFYPVLDPSGTAVLRVRDAATATDAAGMLDRGVPIDVIRRMLDGAPAPAAVPDDGYSPESVAGMVQSPDEIARIVAAAEAEAPGEARPVHTAPASTAAAMESNEPISIPFPALGSAYWFVNPKDLPVFDTLVIAQTAAAAQDPDPDARAQAFIGLAPDVLKRFMLPDEFMRFASDARGQLVEGPHGRQLVGGLRGEAGARALGTWIAEEIVPRYTTFPTPPGAS